MIRLLLVEDDDILGDGLVAGLSMEGYSVDWLTNGLLADEALKNTSYEVIILDLGLPKMDGITVLKNLRSRANPAPVLILTARDNVTDRVTGLDSGADDFVVKPFDLTEVCARLRALTRRQEGRAQPLLKHGDLILDMAAHKVFYQAQPIDLSQREFAILHFLLSNLGKVISRTRLEESLYSWNCEIESNTIEVHIHHLRKKLENNLIRTVRGVGYIIDTI
jgi:two-component system OmpR family response regulator/two-component system response regulator QseB